MNTFHEQGCDTFSAWGYDNRSMTKKFRAVYICNKVICFTRVVNCKIALNLYLGRRKNYRTRELYLILQRKKMRKMKKKRGKINCTIGGANFRSPPPGTDYLAGGGKRDGCRQSVGAHTQPVNWPWCDFILKRGFEMGRRLSCCVLWYLSVRNSQLL